MKKLTKKSLDELAQEMPTVTEIQQRECVGGYRFLGATGDYMGDNAIGGDFIHIISGTDYSGFQTAVNHKALSTYQGGVALAGLSDNQKTPIYLGLCSGTVSGFDINNYSGATISDYSKPAIFINDQNQLIFNDSNYQLDSSSNFNAAWSNFLSGFDVP